MEYERIREQIAIRMHTFERTNARILYETAPINISWEKLTEGWRANYRIKAIQILSLNGIEIRADDQNLPFLLGYVGTAEGMATQQDMLTAGFVKVKPKPKLKGKGV